SRRRHTRWPRDWSSDVCSSDLENKTVFDAATVMAAKFIGSVVVNNSSAVKGIFTERDLMRIVAQRQDPSQVKLKDVMRTDLVSRSEERRVGKSGGGRMSSRSKG